MPLPRSYQWVDYSVVPAFLWSSSVPLCCGTWHSKAERWKTKEKLEKLLSPTVELLSAVCYHPSLTDDQAIPAFFPLWLDQPFQLCLCSDCFILIPDSIFSYDIQGASLELAKRSFQFFFFWVTDRARGSALYSIVGRTVQRFKTYANAFVVPDQQNDFSSSPANKATKAKHTLLGGGDNNPIGSR